MIICTHLFTKVFFSLALALPGANIFLQKCGGNANGTAHDGSNLANVATGGGGDAGL
jgi:hypothetical protein